VLSLVHHTNANNLDVFSVGTTSRAIAKRLTAVISDQLKGAQTNSTPHFHFPLSDGSATVLLIDRVSFSSFQLQSPTHKLSFFLSTTHLKTIDLVGVMSHGDNLLDQMNELLSMRSICDVPSSLTCDIGVSLEQLDKTQQTKPSTKYQNVGSIAHPSDKGSIALLDAFALKKSKESLLFLRKTLADICLSSKLPLDFSQQV